jgi:predicted nuclease with TOPRIM domain
MQHGVALPRRHAYRTYTYAHARDNFMNKLKPHEILNEVKTLLQENYHQKQKIENLQKEIQKLKIQNQTLKEDLKVLNLF